MQEPSVPIQSVGLNAYQMCELLAITAQNNIKLTPQQKQFLEQFLPEQNSETAKQQLYY